MIASLKYFFRIGKISPVLPGAALVFFSLISFAQPGKGQDTALVRKLNAEAFDSALMNPKASLAIAEHELSISQSIDYKWGIAGALISEGYAYFHMGDMKNALQFEQEGLAYSKQNNLPKPEACAFSRLGNLYTVIGELDKAFENYEQELVIRRQMNDSLYIADCYINMGLILARKEVSAEAIINYQKAADLYHTFHDSFNEARALSAIGEMYISRKEYPKAHEFIMRSLKINGNGDTYNDLGSYYDDMGKNDSALFCYSAAYQMFATERDRPAMARALANVGEIEVKNGSYQSAEKHIREAFQIEHELGYLQEMSESANNLASLYVKKKDYKNACDFLIQAKTLRDSFYKIEMASKLAELGTRFDVKEVAEKNKALQNLNALQQLKLQRKNIFIAGALSALATLLVIGFLLFRQSKLKAIQQKTELEQRQLRAQMNPHFIFNCLNSIQHFVVANDVKNANKYLSGFALLMRQTLENSKQGIVSLRKETAYLENYLVLERMRFEDKFSYEMTCAEGINIDQVEIPAMIIQPFVENAIRHGLCYLDGKHGKLKIWFYKRDRHLYCEVDDNGIGRDRSQELKIVSEIAYESHGMELTRQRLALVSKSSGSEYSIEMIDKKNAGGDPGGTTIIIKFPLET